ncbi:MAG TPA: hypothetical protein PKA74_19065, partial [Bauldia sp.]|nr:hypothetical protein [Bauldia sp.]
MEDLAVPGIAVRFNPNGGMLDRVAIPAGGRTIEPLHRAPWLDTPEDVPADAAPHLRWLAGDFFCAPFAKPDVEPAPAHGWAANGVWAPRGRATAADGALTATFELDHAILGGTLAKDIVLRPGHPVVYQRHVFTGGTGGIPIAHHAMIRVPGGARLSFSAKDFGGTPTTPQESVPERGRSILAYPQRFDDLSAVKLAGGGTVDARAYPYGNAHEDFLTLFDPPAAEIGWSAALAKADGFLFFAVKDARLLPQTSLWMSDGGRHYAPWLSRHTAVLGIEESCTHYGDGHRLSAAENDLSRAGYRPAVTLSPEEPTVVRYALGAIPADPAWSVVADIALADGALVITDAGGATARV